MLRSAWARCGHRLPILLNAPRQHLLVIWCAASRSRVTRSSSRSSKTLWAVIATHCIQATRAGKGPGPGAQAAAATTFSCAPSNLKRGGSFTVLSMSRDPKLARARCAAAFALAVGQKCCWWVLFANMTLASADPFTVNKPASVPVSVSDAAPRQISLFGR